MFFQIQKTDDLDLLDIELDIYQEARIIGSSTPPSITFYVYNENSYIIETEPFMATMFKEDYNGDIFVLEDEQTLGEPVSSKLETIYKKFENGLFKNKKTKKEIRSLPKKVYETLKYQNEQLYDCVLNNETLQNEVQRRTQMNIEDDSKLVWTHEENDRGTVNILQFRSHNLRILVKIASNNFANMFVKIRYPPTGLALESLQDKCKKIKFQLFGSIIRGDENGLVTFYNNIIEEF